MLQRWEQGNRRGKLLKHLKQIQLLKRLAKIQNNPNVLTGHDGDEKYIE